MMCKFLKMLFIYIRNSFFILTTILLFLLICGFVFERISRYAAEKDILPFGSFVDVGGYNLNYVKKGEDGPTIIFETGHTFQGMLFSYSWV
jgi:hypothetical protein